MLRPSRGAVALCLFAGTSDTLTGLGLLLAPAAVLGALRVPLPTDMVFIRWLGVFVFAVGALYGTPFARREPAARFSRLLGALEATALVRGAVAAFLGVAVASGALAAAWLTVAAFDAGVAAIQVALLARGRVGRVA
ncbi:MAG: hypothetical protein KBD01_18960 [Acidobacteria bacterium]|nr:hypothetical protein [Acidobacteriota bacterium]